MFKTIMLTITTILASTFIFINCNKNEKTSYNARGKIMEKSQLKKTLTPLQYRVTQKDGTEPPFSNQYWDNKKEGIYVDIVSGEPLFSSIDKFTSGTGWPSFTRPLDKNNIIEKVDRKLFMKRIEVRSKNANSHLGHVFDDGPAPTGLRYCINSAALRFIPVENLDKEGYGEYKSLFTMKNKNKDSKTMEKVETATFGAGCFWGVEHILNEIDGVIETTAGYMGGSSKTATYNHVRTGDTGHAEVVQIKFNANVISYEKLLDYFWRLHDPTTLNRQGVDVGTQYRSVIFFHSEDQKKIAIDSKKKFDQSGVFKSKAVTEIAEAEVFYDAEDYHQDYYQKNGGRVCHILREK